MVDPDRWTKWLTLLDYVKSTGQPMTMGDYVLAMQYDNAPTVQNPDQADSDHNGIGDVVDGAALIASDISLVFAQPATSGVFTATLKNGMGSPIAAQAVQFACDFNNDGVSETVNAVTDASGVASVPVAFTLSSPANLEYTASWNGKVISASVQKQVSITGACSRADFDGDCDVDYGDLQRLLAKWLEQGDPANCTIPENLAGSDCRIDFADFAEFVKFWAN
jgi:hypothetical protein